MFQLCNLVYFNVRCIHYILYMLVSEKIYGAYIKLPSQNTCLHESILNDDALYPYFRDCIGTIDGTHIPAKLLHRYVLSMHNSRHISACAWVAATTSAHVAYIVPLA